MITLVGSLNPVKVDGVRQAIGLFYPSANLDFVEGRAVESGVDHQPTTMAEAIVGAYNRALAVGKLDNTIDLAVGIEGGIWASPFHLGVDLPTYFDTQWVIVWARQTDTWWCAGTVSIPVPPAILQNLSKSIGIGGACDIVFGLEKSKQGPGLTGLLANHHLDRTQAIRDATLFALGRVKHPHLFP